MRTYLADDLITEHPETASPGARVRIEVEDEIGVTIHVLRLVDVTD